MMHLLDYDVNAKEMVDPEYGWRRDLERACMFAYGGLCSTCEPQARVAQQR
jgi:hypothetical protein